jgi:hypothetical protein
MSHSGVAGATSFSVVVRGAVDFAGSCGATQQLQPCWATGRVMAANAWQQLACSAAGEAWQQPESQQQVAACPSAVGTVAVGSVEFATQQAASPLHAQAISTAGMNPVCNASSPKTSQRSEDGS